MTCVLTAGLSCSPLGAQEAAAEGEVALEELSLIGRMFFGWQGASDAVYDTPGAVAQIGREAIDDRGGARNTADILRSVSGVNAVIDRQTPGLNVNIRGLQDQGRVSMTIDGARQNFQQSGHGAPSFAFIDPELIGGVDIDKGPTSTAGGAGVIGGVVNFRTLVFDDIALPDKDYGVRVNATTGTNAFDFNGSLAAAAKVSEAFELVGAVGRKKLGEYDAGTHGDLVYDKEGGFGKFTTQDQWSWLAKATAEVAENQKVTLAYTGLAADFGTGSGEFIDTNKVTTHTVVADWRWAPGLWWADFAAKLYYTRTSNDQFRPDRNPDSTVGTDAFSVDYKIDTVGGSLTNTSRFTIPMFDVALTYGVEYFHDKTATASVAEDPADDPTGSSFSGSNPNGERGVGGAFARAELKRDWLTILLGGRLDAYNMTGSGVVFDGLTTGCGLRSCPTPFDVDKSGARFSPTATVAVTPREGVQVYASYEQGYRPPNIMETVLGGTHPGGALSVPFGPNPDLKPEVSRTYELGLNLKRDGLFIEGDAFRAKASVYMTDVDNYITDAYVFTDVRDFFMNVNLTDRTRLNGIDLELNYDAGVAYLGGSATFLNSEFGDKYDAGPGNRFTELSGIYLAPKRKLVLDGGLRFLERKLTVGARVTDVLPERGLSGELTGLFRYEPYTLLDLYSSYKLNDNLTFRAAIENLTDVAYVEAMAAALSASPGRTFTIGATARF
ncbi:TonB-dependent hemoglobin/transferrin/lactoferrin family receptor [Hansschlegelia zhihuaiae]|nr:TonB-dependent hemoglobin/transferrin/lactoferrin family receptor [Hansschlegelia zhihuaiae]